MRTSRLIPVLSFIILGLVSRFVPHLPNCTAINAIALLGAYSVGSLWLSLLTVSAIMLSSDLVFGLHNCMPFVYLSYGLVILLGSAFQSKNSNLRNSTLVIFSSFLFFAVTNFGSWLTNPMYAKTASGLALCYTAALPFLLNQILGDLFFCGFILCGMNVLSNTLTKRQAV